MFNVALYEPEIPPNTGNIIRLCANAGAKLHLIHPLGFVLEDKKLQRAGLDYHEFAPIQQHRDYAAFSKAMQPKRVFACSTKGTVCYADVSFRAGDTLLFGPESRGLPADILAIFPAGHVIKIPMQPTSRSLNLSNAVAVILYEAWRQLTFS